MDLSYATIPTCENTFVTLHKMYHVDDTEYPMNEIVYMEEELGSFYFLSNFMALKIESTKVQKVQKDNETWGKKINGAHSKSNISLGIIYTSPKSDTFNFAYIP